MGAPRAVASDTITRPWYDEPVTARDLAVLGVIASVAAAAYVRWALRWHLGYDEAWHVFSSTVAPWSHFVAELQREAHPPLYYVLLRWTVPRADSLLWPRLVSIAAGTATVVLAFHAARALRMARPIAFLTCLAFALAPAHVNLAACARGYALATTFTLLAYLVCLQRARSAQPPRGIALVVAATLAMATEYSAALVVVTIVLVCTALAHGRVAASPAITRRGEVAALVLACGAIASYRRWTFAPAYAHLPEFFPAPDASLSRFALSGIAATLSSLLSPLAVRPDGRGAVWCALAIVAMAVATYRYLAPSGRRRDGARASVLLTHTVLWAVLFLASVAGAYPFGGRMRHQFVLFPFLVLTIMLGVDELYAHLRGRAIRVAACLGLGLAVVLGFHRGTAGRPLEEFTTARMWEADVAVLAEALQPDDAVYVTQYGSIAMFANFPERWVHEARLEDRYDVFTRGDRVRRLVVVRDIGLWTAATPPTPAFVADLAHVLDLVHRPTLWVLSLPQEGSGGVPIATEALARLCAAEGLALERRVPLPSGEALRVRRVAASGREPA